MLDEEGAEPENCRHEVSLDELLFRTIPLLPLLVIFSVEGFRDEADDVRYDDEDPLPLFKLSRRLRRSK
jgi:hypothetical protein